MGSKKNKTERYAITDVSMKDISNVIKEFEILPYKVYVRKRLKHEPDDSYFHPERHLAKFTMRANTFNLNFDPVRTQ